MILYNSTLVSMYLSEISQTQSKKAIHRIGLSSLYLGTGSLQRHLLNSIFKRAKNIPSLQIKMLFDYNRSLRQQKGQSPVEMINNYLNDDLKRKIQISFHRQSHSKHKVFGEVSGVHHQKIAIFDNNIIIGGANLSQNYFINRRDRYLKFLESDELADYLYDYLRIMCENGYQIDKKPSLPPNTNLKNHYNLWKFGNSPQQYKQTLFQQQKELQKIKTQRQTQNKRTIDKQRKKQIPKNKNLTLAELLGSDIQQYKQIDKKERLQKREQVRQKLSNILDENDVGNHLMEIQRPKNNQQITQIGEKVYIFPFIQFPQLNQSLEQEVVKQVLSNSIKNKNEIRISSGYLNLSPEILKILSQSSIPNQILCSSPQANSFYRAGIIKKYIPFFYRNFQGMILEKWPNKFKIKEYFDGKWSFHAKGLWIKQSQNNYLTVVGSSNYNVRSKQRDTQLQLYLYSTCAKFNQRLEQQWKHIQKDCKQVSLQQIKQDQQIKFNSLFKILSKIMSRFL